VSAEEHAMLIDIDFLPPEEGFVLTDEIDREETLAHEPHPMRAEPRDLKAGEVDFANLMTKYLRDVRPYRALDAGGEAALLRAIDAGDADARDRLICHHLGLVIAMARRFANRGLELLDLIEEGNLGMLVALQKFDASRGLRFSTYATWWIRYYLQTAIATQVPIVRPPLRAQRRAGQQAWQAWCDSHGAANGDMQDGTLPAPTAAPLVTPLALHDADIEAQFAQADLCHPDVAGVVGDALDTTRLARLLRELVAALPVKQREIVIARFGLDGQDSCTLQDLGSERGVSRERMRQVQVLALDALRGGLARAGINRSAVFS
jgi:RNA polymerase sigma factor (sigma-70 family)